MLRSLSVLPAAAVLALTGCGGNAGGLSATGGTPSTTRVTSNSVAFDLETSDERLVSRLWIRAPMQRVNEVLPRVLTDLGFEIEPLDGDETRLRSEPLSVNRRLAGEPVSTYLDCGRNPIGAPNANTHTVQLYLDVQVTGGEEGAQLMTQLEARATPRASSGGVIRCVTTGRLEQRIAAEIQARISI
jgi:hypothetical protein